MGLPPAAAPPFRPRRTLRARALALLLVQVPSPEQIDTKKHPTGMFLCVYAEDGT